jgi:hypothetical protein
MAWKEITENDKTLFEDKFNTSYVIVGDCWLWSRMMTVNGYGALRSGKRVLLAHRFSFWLKHGSIPASKLVVDHICNVRKCVNPDHLQLLTIVQNAMKDRVRKTGVRRAGKCKDPEKRRLYLKEWRKRNRPRLREYFRNYCATIKERKVL